LALCGLGRELFQAHSWGVLWRLKILFPSAIGNAARALALRDEFGSLAAYFWRMEPDPANRPARITRAALRVMTTSAESEALSRDLKKRGWSFVGPTTVYAFMQAMGLVNDHVQGCATRERALAARKVFRRPT